MKGENVCTNDPVGPPCTTRIIGDLPSLVAAAAPGHWAGAKYKPPMVMLSGPVQLTSSAARQPVCAHAGLASLSTRPVAFGAAAYSIAGI